MRLVFILLNREAVVKDYPRQCEQRFAEKCAELKAAKFHADMKRIRSQIDSILDDYLSWLAVYGD